VEFGGPSAASLAFVGWSSTDDRYLDTNGVGVGSRLTDFPPTGAEPDIYICGPSVRSDVAASGLALVSDLSYFGTAFSGLEAYVVQQLSIGPKLGDFNRGC
jgi:hypothetical protein